MDRYKQLGGYTYKKTVEVMINKFGFSAEDKNKLLSEFSGGERMKISFMKLLLSNPDLLILDEPTNHLDVTTIEWLEGYLKNYKKAFIVVSHDRMFLDNIVDIIYDIEYGQTIKYVGNYTKYVELKEQRYNKLLKDYEYQQSEIKRLRQLYERFRSKPTKAKMALSKLKQIERMTIIDKPQKANTKSFSANTKGIATPSKIVLNARELEFGYDKSLGKISLEVESGKKIAIIGSNGAGKSTLLKTLCGIIKPYAGKVSYGFNVKYDYFDQNLEFSTKGSILEEFRSKYPDLLNEEARKALGSFLFTGEDVQKELKVLSGGEKVRLLLCEVFFSKSNLLFLDEPTNHLDIIGKEKLEKTLKEYPQTVIFVSHDRYFVNKVADELIVLEDNQVKYYRYGYADYLQDRSKKKEQESLKTTNKVKNVKTSIPDKNNKHVIKKLEKEIELIDKKIKELSQELYKEDNFNDYEKMNSINKEIEELKNKLSLKEQEWEKLVTD